MTMSSIGAIGQIRNQVMWNRLLAVVEEQAHIMMRTAFSTTVREAGDLSAGIFDVKGRMLAQAVTGTPGHVNSMAESVSHFLAKFPAETMKPGDHYITNDPWLGTGHLHDLVVVTPAFLDGRIVALFANTAHMIDVGGRGLGTDARSVYEEGIYIPIVKCFDQGVANETFFDFMRAASRMPMELVGDIYSLCTCNEAGARRLLDMMRDFDLDNLDPLANYIFDSTLKATLDEIAKLPKGRFEGEINSDGYETALSLRAVLTIGEGEVSVSFEGTSGPSRFAINVPAAYTRAYSGYGLKIVIAPDVPNNWASLLPFKTLLPQSCILNAQHPAPVGCRHIVGHFLPDLIMNCLALAVPETVLAEGAACLWNPPLRGGYEVSGEPTADKPVVEDFDLITMNSGGMGARPTSDGLSATAFPSGVRTTSVEAQEAVSPIVFWRKELRPDSAGPGRFRGGFGQVIEIGTKGDLEFACNAIFDRVSFAPKGRHGGGAALSGRVSLKSGRNLPSKGYQVIPDRDRLVLELPGGGGMGAPSERATQLVAKDLTNELISRETARAVYKVAIDARGAVDVAGTLAMRECVELVKGKRHG